MNNTETDDFKPFNPLQVIVPVLLLMLSVSFAARWYSQQVSLPRYCENPEQTVMYLQKIITETRPAGEQSRRPYIIAAKLIFLLPRESNETDQAYIKRVKQYLRKQCG